MLALAETLQNLCDNAWQTETYKKMSADYICDAFNWDDVTGKTLALYGVKHPKVSAPAKEEKEYESVTH